MHIQMSISYIRYYVKAIAIAITMVCIDCYRIALGLLLDPLGLLLDWHLIKNKTYIQRQMCSRHQLKETS